MATFNISVSGTDKFPVGQVVKLFTTTDPSRPPETNVAPTLYPWVTDTGVTATVDAAGQLAFIGASSTQLVPANGARTGLYVSNTHPTQDAYLSLGGTAVAGQGIYLKAGGGSAYIADYTGVVNAIAAGAGTGLSFSEV
jgi:hypothetical protein